MKQTLVIVAPYTTLSGYGVHSRLIIRSILNNEKIIENFDVRLISTRWGSTPQYVLKNDVEEDKFLLDLNLPNNQLTYQPDVSIQIALPNEFQKIGKKSIGITAGTEATISPIEFLKGMNIPDFVIVPSEFSKDVLVGTKYDKKDDQGNVVETIQCSKPVEVLFEGLNANVFDKTKIVPTESLNQYLNSIEESFCYLFTGHYLNGNLGHDRKDVGMLIKTFLSTFKNKKNRPALLLKVSGAGFSIAERDVILNKINQIQQSVREEGFQGKLPSVYLLNGELTDEEMNQLYNHPKVKSFVSFTHAEGFGLPLLEFASTGKPIVAPNYSGHLDFLKPEFNTLLPGKLIKIDNSAVNEWLPKEGEWFRVDYNFAGQIMKDVFENYDKYLERSRKQPKYIKDNFSIESMSSKLVEIFEKYNIFNSEPKRLSINLPKLKKV